MTTPFRYFNQQAWPVPCAGLDSVEHRLRFSDPEYYFSMEDRLIAASVINAYQGLIWRTQVERNAVIKELRKGPNA
jgi:hypothetical protein